MKIYTNRYPVLGNCIYPSPDGEMPNDAFKDCVPAGKIWSVAGISQMDVIVVCEGKHVVVTADNFKLAFVEVELPI